MLAAALEAEVDAYLAELAHERAPAQKCSLPSHHIAGNGATCGRPSRRTVDNQNISDDSRTLTTFDHCRAVASGSLNSATR